MMRDVDVLQWAQDTANMSPRARTMLTRPASPMYTPSPTVLPALTAHSATATAPLMVARQGSSVKPRTLTPSFGSIRKLPRTPSALPEPNLSTPQRHQQMVLRQDNNSQYTPSASFGKQFNNTQSSSAHNNSNSMALTVPIQYSGTQRSMTIARSRRTVASLLPHELIELRGASSQKRGGHLRRLTDRNEGRSAVQLAPLSHATLGIRHIPMAAVEKNKTWARVFTPSPDTM
eukprot:PhM_4_TR8639/c0_g2_i1/m.67912